VLFSGSVTGHLGFVYDNDFRVEEMTVGSEEIGFEYDDDGALTQAGELGLNYAPATGFLTNAVLGGVSESYTYNGYGELHAGQSATTNALLFACEYEYDALGRITNKTEVILDETNTFAYAYDTMGRLKQVYTNGALCSAYGYDANGNRTSFTSATEVVTNMVYDDHDRLLRVDGASSLVSYTYDLAGDLTSVSSATSVVEYDYDSFGNLLSADLNVTNIVYTIDPLNRRIGKTVNGTPIQKFIYKDQLNPVVEFDGSNNVVSIFVYAEKGHVPAYMLKGTNTYRIISDHLGSVRLVIAIADGSVMQRIDYDEFGNVLQDTSPGFQPFGFHGGLYDRDTGFVHFGARDYDPKVGRWLTKDALGFEGGNNLYLFCGNDSINRIDPTGLVDLNLSGEHSADEYIGKLGYYDLAIHGRRNVGIFVDKYNTPIPVEIVYALMKANGYRDGTPINLISCYAGLDSGDARKLASMAGAEVLTSTGEVALAYKNPPYLSWLGHLEQITDGEWVKLGPESFEK